MTNTPTEIVAACCPRPSWNPTKPPIAETTTGSTAATTCGSTPVSAISHPVIQPIKTPATTAEKLAQIWVSLVDSTTGARGGPTNIELESFDGRGGPDSGSGRCIVLQEIYKGLWQNRSFMSTRRRCGGCTLSPRFAGFDAVLELIGLECIVPDRDFWCQHEGNAESKANARSGHSMLSLETVDGNRSKDVSNVQPSRGMCAVAFFDGAPVIFGGRISTACPPLGEQNAAIWRETGTLREHDDTGGRGLPSAGRWLGRVAMSEVRQTVSRCRGAPPRRPASACAPRARPAPA